MSIFFRKFTDFALRNQPFEQRKRNEISIKFNQLVIGKKKNYYKNDVNDSFWR